MNKTLILIIFTCLVGCAANSPITNFESKGGLEATNPLACVSATSVGPASTAADIIAGAKDCESQAKLNETAELIMVASAYAFYDTQRVADKTAHSALTALIAKAFGSLPETNRAKLFAGVKALGDDKLRKGAICTYLRSATPPTYFPNYMIAHGMAAFSGAVKEPLIKDFNSDQAWSKSMVFVKCDS